jgi:hypothetical protein
MKPPSQVAIGLHRLLRIFLLLVAGVFGTACSRGQTSPVAAARLQSATSQGAAASSPARTLPAQPMCPPAGLLPLQTSTPGTGHHRVTLTWDASSLSKTGGKAVGYCLYRSKAEHAAKKNPNCKRCESVNQVPVTSLSCVDDVVQDNTTYYYVVTGISSASRISSSSNEISAPIPAGDQIRPASSVSSPAPLCREASAAQYKDSAKN